MDGCYIDKIIRGKFQKRYLSLDSGSKIAKVHKTHTLKGPAISMNLSDISTVTVPSNADDQKVESFDIICGKKTHSFRLSGHQSQSYKFVKKLISMFPALVRFSGSFEELTEICDKGSKGELSSNVPPPPKQASSDNSTLSHNSFSTVKSPQIKSFQNDLKSKKTKMEEINVGMDDNERLELEAHNKLKDKVLFNGMKYYGNRKGKGILKKNNKSKRMPPPPSHKKTTTTTTTKTTTTVPPPVPPTSEIPPPTFSIPPVPSSIPPPARTSVVNDLNKKISPPSIPPPPSPAIARKATKSLSSTSIKPPPPSHFPPPPQKPNNSVSSSAGGGSHKYKHQSPSLLPIKSNNGNGNGNDNPKPPPPPRRPSSTASVKSIVRNSGNSNVVPPPPPKKPFVPKTNPRRFSGTSVGSINNSNDDGDDCHPKKHHRRSLSQNSIPPPPPKRNAPKNNNNNNNDKIATVSPPVLTKVLSDPELVEKEESLVPPPTLSISVQTTSNNLPTSNNLESKESKVKERPRKRSITLCPDVAGAIINGDYEPKDMKKIIEEKLENEDNQNSLSTPKSKSRKLRNDSIPHSVGSVTPTNTEITTASIALTHDHIINGEIDDEQIADILGLELRKGKEDDFPPPPPLNGHVYGAPPPPLIRRATASAALFKESSKPSEHASDLELPTVSALLPNPLLRTKSSVFATETPAGRAATSISLIDETDREQESTSPKQLPSNNPGKEESPRVSVSFNDIESVEEVTIQTNNPFAENSVTAAEITENNLLDNSSAKNTQMNPFGTSRFGNLEKEEELKERKEEVGEPKDPPSHASVGFGFGVSMETNTSTSMGPIISDDMTEEEIMALLLAEEEAHQGGVFGAGIPLAQEFPETDSEDDNDKNNNNVENEKFDIKTIPVVKDDDDGNNDNDNDNEEESKLSSEKMNFSINTSSSNNNKEQRHSCALIEGEVGTSKNGTESDDDVFTEFGRDSSFDEFDPFSSPSMIAKSPVNDIIHNRATVASVNTTPFGEDLNEGIDDDYRNNKKSIESNSESMNVKREAKEKNGNMRDMNRPTMKRTDTESSIVIHAAGVTIENTMSSFCEKKPRSAETLNEEDEDMNEENENENGKISKNDKKKHLGDGAPAAVAVRTARFSDNNSTYYFNRDSSIEEDSTPLEETTSHEQEYNPYQMGRKPKLIFRSPRSSAPMPITSSSSQLLNCAPPPPPGVFRSPGKRMRVVQEREADNSKSKAKNSPSISEQISSEFQRRTIKLNEMEKAHLETNGVTNKSSSVGFASSNPLNNMHSKPKLTISTNINMNNSNSNINSNPVPSSSTPVLINSFGFGNSNNNNNNNINNNVNVNANSNIHHNRGGMLRKISVDSTVSAAVSPSMPLLRLPSGNSSIPSTIDNFETGSVMSSSSSRVRRKVRRSKGAKRTRSSFDLLAQANNSPLQTQVPEPSISIRELPELCRLPSTLRLSPEARTKEVGKLEASLSERNEQLKFKNDILKRRERACASKENIVKRRVKAHYGDEVSKWMNICSKTSNITNSTSTITTSSIFEKKHSSLSSSNHYSHHHTRQTNIDPHKDNTQQENSETSQKIVGLEGIVDKLSKMVPSLEEKTNKVLQQHLKRKEAKLKEMQLQTLRAIVRKMRNERNQMESDLSSTIKQSEKLQSSHNNILQHMISKQDELKTQRQGIEERCVNEMNSLVARAQTLDAKAQNMKESSYSSALVIAEASSPKKQSKEWAKHHFTALVDEMKSKDDEILKCQRKIWELQLINERMKTTHAMITLPSTPVHHNDDYHNINQQQQHQNNTSSKSTFSPTIPLPPKYHATKVESHILPEVCLKDISITNTTVVHSPTKIQSGRHSQPISCPVVAIDLPMNAIRPM